MNYENNDFNFSNVKKTKAKLLPEGWYWLKYDDGSGCLKAPDDKEYMIYDLYTNEYKVTRNTSYDFFPVSPYYIDGVDPKKFNPFEYMEEEIKRKYIKTNIMDKRLEILNDLKKYQETDKMIPKGFNYDDYGFYLGIKNIKNDLSIEDLDRLMKICDKSNTYYINPMYLAEELTRAVFIKEFISIDELEKLEFDKIYDVLKEDKLYLFKDYLHEDIENDFKND